MRDRSRLLPSSLLVALPLLLVGCSGPGADQSGGSGGSAASPPDPCRPYEGLKPTQGQVTITVQGNTVKVDPPRPRIQKGQGELEWTSTDGPFVILAGPGPRGRPFVDETFGAGAGATARQGVNPVAECGTYKFGVVVWDAANDRLVGVDPPVDIVPGW